MKALRFSFFRLILAIVTFLRLTQLIFPFPLGWSTLDPKICAYTPHNCMKSSYFATLNGGEGGEGGKGGGGGGGGRGKDFSKRRIKQNKYKKFSNAPVLDPIEENIERLRREERRNQMKVSADARGGTTTPRASRPSKILLAERKNFTELGVTYASLDPNDPSSFGFERIGFITGPHGVKGELKVKMESDFGNERMAAGSLLYVRKPGRRAPRPIELISGRSTTRGFFLIRIKGLMSRLSASFFTGYDIYVSTSNRPTLEKDEYLARDMYGVSCYCMKPSRGSDNEQKEPIKVGVVNGVVLPDDLADSAFAAKFMHAMLEVRLVPSNRLCLIPLVPEIVPKIELHNDYIEIDPPKGLMNLTYEDKEKKVRKKFTSSINRFHHRNAEIFTL